MKLFCEESWRKVTKQQDNSSHQQVFLLIWQKTKTNKTNKKKGVADLKSKFYCGC